MSAFRLEHWSRWLIIPPVVLGIVVVMWMAASKQPPVQAERGEPSRTVRVIEAPLVDLIPRADGYGPVQPARIWTAVSQVAGRVSCIHSKLRDGEILPEGTELVRIDPKDYEIALAQAEAELAELEVQEANARASLKIEKRNEELAQKELERIRKLLRQGTSSQSAADEKERSMLAYRAAVQNLENTLALVPAQRSLLEARAALAERDLERTIILAPFDMRVANLNVEADQYVSVGQNLFEGDAVDRVEIEAQVAMSSLRRLFIGRPDFKIDVQRLSEEFSEIIDMDPLVQMDLGNHVAEWRAEFVRFSDIVDAETRTMGVVVAVDRPFDKVKPGYRPPLSKGMFVRVVLSGNQHTKRLVVPRSAVRAGVVYVADENNRLRRRAVKTLFSQGDVTVIEQGLEAGARVVVSDLVPAVEGMLLQVQLDEALNQSLQAAGGGA
jgi:RND family efflux transporter MFP subunit